MLLVHVHLQHGRQLVSERLRGGLDKCAGLLYSLDFFLSFHVGFIMTHGWRKRIVMHGRSIAKYYFKRGTAVVDMLSVIPFVVQVRLHASLGCRSWPPVRVIGEQSGHPEGLLSQIILICVPQDHHAVAHAFQFVRLLRLVRARA